MITDERGLALTTGSEDAARHLDTVVSHYVKYRWDTSAWVVKMLEADPNFVMGHCVKGYLLMTAFDARRLGLAAESLAKARVGEEQVTPRERLHVAALAAWHRGDLDAAFEAWRTILAEHPKDMLAVRLAHFNYFWLGDAGRLRDVVAEPLGHWDASTPGYGSMLAMLAFGEEERGDYRTAEDAALRSLEHDRAELWATHARAHVMEMEGRHREGVEWLAGEERYWEGGNNMLHHLWWHRALLHWELGEHGAVLELYDRKFRNLDSPITRAIPDLYIDIQNAVSMLWRLEAARVGVGSRWIELADKAVERVGDVQNLFTLPHFVMALAAAGRGPLAERFLNAIGDAAKQELSSAATLREVELPLCAATLAYRQGDFAHTVTLMQPIRHEIRRIGGSHAQRDLFTQMLLDAALKSGRTALARTIVQEESRARPIPIAGRTAYAAAARQLLN
jgi:tetratricopeptide (TPR) repeat protein